MKPILAVLVTMVIGIAISATPVAAQYPPPAPPIVATPSNPNPGVGETITLSIAVTGAQASAIDGTTEGVRFVSARTPSLAELYAALASAAPFSCTANVSGGSGATVTPSSFTTDANGRATISLFTGSQAASLVVAVQCGAYTTQIVVPVGGGGSLPLAPPDTGTGPGRASGSWLPGSTWILIVAGLVLLAIAPVSYARMRRRSPSPRD